ncbi:MAG: outer membrane lipoprotein-sorting protein [Stenotrophobium sp.]
MKRLWVILAALILTPAHAAETAQQVLACMHANIPSTLRVQDIELATTDSNGAVNTLKGTVYAMREPAAAGRSLMRVMLHVSAPPSFAGAAYLVREETDYLKDGMFVYLPSVKRVRRVTGTFADGALLGTNFSYNDFKQMENAFGDSAAKLEAPDSVDGRPAYVLQFKPRAGEASLYTSVRSWVDQKTCVPLKLNFYAGTKLRKSLTSPADALQQSGKFWYLSQVEMHDLETGTKTVLRVNHVTIGAPLSKNYFNPVSFYQGN